MIASDPVAAADAVVADVDPGLSSPGVDGRDAVLVTGPWLAGTSSLISVLRERMPDRTFVEAGDLSAAEAPCAVVFVVSASTPLTESECALVDLAANYTDLVIGAVSKIDTHQEWRDVLEANRALLAGRAPRYREMPWAGVAAAPDEGEPTVDELVDLLGHRLDDPDTQRRNRLRAWETRLESVIGRYQGDAAGQDRAARVSTLRDRREEIQSGRRLSKSERSIGLRTQIQQARVQLAYFARKRCTSVRSELQEDVARWSCLPLGSARRRRIDEFDSYVRDRADEVVDEVDEGIVEHLGDVATELGLTAPGSTVLSDAGRPPPPELSSPPLRSRGLEHWLMLVLGAGFGLGVALAVSRLFADAAPGLTIAGLAAGALVGLLVMLWVVGIRGVLHDRAVLDRWITESTSALRSSVEGLVATRVLAAEAALTAELAASEEVESAAAADQVAEIDAELREHSIATARAASLRDRRLPPLQRALEAVRAQLYGAGDEPTDSAGTSG